jgi:competence protein ComEA
MAAPRRKKQPVREKPAWRPLLRHSDQMVVGTLVAAALVGMAAYWLVRGGYRGGLVDIDRAEPLVARYLVDINRAEWPELAQLPRVGPILARRIVDSRLARGPFADHDDLLRVDGIGPRTLDQMKPYLLPMPDRQDVAGGVPLTPPVQ